MVGPRVVVGVVVMVRMVTMTTTMTMTTAACSQQQVRVVPERKTVGSGTTAPEREHVAVTHQEHSFAET